MTCSCHNGATCSPQDGSCTCAPGYRGPTCQRCECPPPSKKLWVAPNLPPPHRPSTPGPETGCTHLTPACPPGRYGKRCSLSCSCANGSSCHPTNGSCLCAPGWHGPRCSQREWGSGRGLGGGRKWGAGLTPSLVSRPPPPACAPSSWGDACAQPCLCHHGWSCHPAEGTCHCPAGWTLCGEGRIHHGHPLPWVCTPWIQPRGSGGERARTAQGHMGYPYPGLSWAVWRYMGPLWSYMVPVWSYMVRGTRGLYGPSMEL